jgi:hypothetical protein
MLLDADRILSATERLVLERLVESPSSQTAAIRG